MMFLSLLGLVLWLSSCRSQDCATQVTIGYCGQTKLVLDIDDAQLDTLINSIEKVNTPFLMDEHKVNVRPANEENLNGYSIIVRGRGREGFFNCLHDNFPFSISNGSKSIYNFKHLLSEKDIELLYVLIPAWRSK